MLKCNYQTYSQPKDFSEITHLYQFFLLSTVLYKDVWKFINKDYDKISLSSYEFNLANELGLPQLTALIPEELEDLHTRPKKNEKQFKSLLMEKYSAFQKSSLDFPKNLQHNIDLLTDAFGLTEAEKMVLLLAFFAELKEECNFLQILSYLKLQNNDCRSPRDVYADLLTSMCDCSYQELYDALSPNGTLVQNSFIEINHHIRNFVYFEINSSLKNNFLLPSKDLADLLSSKLCPGKESSLSIEDFEYLNPMFERITKYLSLAIKKRQEGVNILLYGPPGTGKTELSRLIAQTIHAKLYEVPTEHDGSPIKDRRVYLMSSLAQLKNNSNAILIFDEAQDLFKNFSNNDFVSSYLDAISSDDNFSTLKGSTNKLLESNQTPIIWITNSINSMDKAYLRRFDFALEVGIPPEKQRLKIIKQKSGGLLSKSALRCLAQRSDIAPALIERTAKIINAEDHSQYSYDERFFEHLNATLKSMKMKAVELIMGADVDALYDPKLSTADTDLIQVANGIAKSKTGRLCLYGVPGTGKSAWAKHLGTLLNKKVIIKRASDLLNCYLGVTEQKIAAAFAEAKREEAILVIDEADSFLQKRSKAHQNWEVSQVNEMLTQIEAFQGIFVATTNNLDMMDEACLRRFDLKVKFDYLESEKAKTLFKNYCQETCPNEPISEELLNEVGRMKLLTPGDFATILRQSRFNPIETPAALLSGLQKECKVKSNHSSHRPIGF